MRTVRPIRPLALPDLVDTGRRIGGREAQAQAWVGVGEMAFQAFHMTIEAGRIAVTRRMRGADIVAVRTSIRAASTRLSVRRYPEFGSACAPASCRRLKKNRGRRNQQTFWNHARPGSDRAEAARASGHSVASMPCGPATRVRKQRR